MRKREEEYQKRTADITTKREAFLTEEGTTEEELASIGFTLSEISSRRKRTRSPSYEGQSGKDTYMLYSGRSGRALRTHKYTRDCPEEARMLDMGEATANWLGVRPEQIKLQKELDVNSGECKVMVTDVSLKSDK